jgi:hypothetical protein
MNDFKQNFYWFTSYLRTPNTIAAFHHCPLHRHCQKNTAHMCSSKKKTRKRKNDSNRRGESWKFDEVSSKMRESVIDSYVEKVVAHAAANGGSCCQGFVKDLVNKAAQVAPLLKITRDDINNKVRNIQGPREQQDVSPAIRLTIFDGWTGFWKW